MQKPLLFLNFEFYYAFGYNIITRQPYEKERNQRKEMKDFWEEGAIAFNLLNPHQISP